MDYTLIDSPESIPVVFVQAWNNRAPDKLASLFDEDAEARQRHQPLVT